MTPKQLPQDNQRMAIRIRVSGVCFSFSFRHSFRYHPAPKESQGIRAPPEEEIRTSSAGTPCADKQRGQTTLRGRPLCAQLLQQLEPLERQRLPSVGAATPQHLSQRLRTHTHTHTLLLSSSNWRTAQLGGQMIRASRELPNQANATTDLRQRRASSR